MNNWIRIFNFLRQRKIILLMFAIAGISTSLEYYGNDSANTWPTAALGVIVFPLIAWFAYKRQSLSVTAATFLLLFMGSNFLYDGFLSLVGKGDEFGFILLIKGITGIYLTWGALILHRERRRKN